MMLVVGGLGSGKREYVRRECGVSDADIAAATLDDRPVLADLHVFVRERGPVDEDQFQALLRKRAVICDEVGCGVVPPDPDERAWREEVGRLCVRLAARAERVVRLCCGIPMIIKGGTP